MKVIITWNSFLWIILFVVLLLVNVMVIYSNSGPEARLEKLKNRNYQYKITCSINGKFTTKYYWDCYSNKSGLRCSNGLVTEFLCQGNYSYIIVPK